MAALCNEGGEIDYWAIREGIKEAIQSYPGLEHLFVDLEPSGDPSMEQTPAVLVFMASRSTPPAIQRIAAGKQTSHRLVFSLWVLHYSPDGLDAAVHARDAVLAKVEVALMRDRHLNGRLPSGLTLEAGETQTGKDAAFAAAAETLVMMDVTTFTQ